jgi:hypothetical protein
MGAFVRKSVWFSFFKKERLCLPSRVCLPRWSELYQLTPKNRRGIRKLRAGGG